MEDYKQKYEEALERAKVINPGTADYEVAVKIFPELKESEDEKIRKELISHLNETIENIRGEEIVHHDAKVLVAKMQTWIAWLEKQGKQEQLYIRFGEIPADEKSKIYQGEIEVGTENGVSVYPAFKTDEGDIILGLNLPITKTTLYTQQHLLEYDNRSCYLVKGDYVGKDTDGQPLINNISIVEKINDYRVKEEQQNKQKPTDKVEPKFKVGDWVVVDDGRTGRIIACTKDFADVDLEFSCLSTRVNNIRSWTIQDAKHGDVLVNGTIVLIVDHLGTFENNPIIYSWYFADSKKFYGMGTSKPDRWDVKGFTPATNEQRDTLFAKMHEAGYEWDAEKKELKKIEQKPAEIPMTLDEAIAHCKEKSCGNSACASQHQQLAQWLTELKEYKEQKPVEWSEKDKVILKEIISFFKDGSVKLQHDLNLYACFLEKKTQIS